MTSGTGRAAAISTAASFVSLLAALTCCLPLGLLLMAAGSAGASMFSISEVLRPWLLGFSAVCLVLAFVQTYVRGRCEFRHRRLRTFLFWFAAAALGATFLAPGFTATLLAGRLPRFKAAAELRTFDEADFLREFRDAQGQTRLVVLLSPT